MSSARQLRTMVWRTLAVGLICLAGLPAVASTASPAGDGEDPAKAALQRRLESGEDLPSRAKTVLFRCREHQDAGDFARAAGIMNTWLGGGENRLHPLLVYNLAVSQLELGDAAAALTSLQAAVRLEPRFARAWLRLGETAYSLERYEPAAEAFAHAHELSPTPAPELLHYCGAAWLQAGRPERALAVLTELLTTHRAGADPDWYRTLVAAAVATDHPERAAPFLDHLLADRPADPAAWDLAYRFAAQGGNYRQAAMCLTVAGYLRPLAPDDLDRLGDLYAAIDVPLVAARCYQRALAAAEAREAATGAATGAATKDGSGAGLAAAPETAAPGDPLARRYRRLASAWLAAFRDDEARAVLQAGLADHEDADLWSLLGDLEYRQENYARSRRAYARSCELDPRNGRGWLMQAYCAIEQGDQPAADILLRRAAGFPDQADAARRLLTRID